jgi:nuclear transcription factor Y, alpha
MVEPRAQTAALPPRGVAMLPCWTGGGLGAVSPAVVAPGIGLSSNSPVSGAATKGGAGKEGDDARGESSEESRRSGESRGSSSFLLRVVLKI